MLAKESSSSKRGLDVTFVLDVSGSMRINDPDGIAFEIIKALIDMVYTEEVRVGFVTYNDEILSSYSPASMAEETNREQLKALIDTTAYSGNTDIGLGLLEAFSFMPKEDGRTRMMVLISDGETDLEGSTTGRTAEESDRDVDRVVKCCQVEDIPIYTIAFGEYGGNTAVLESIAQTTGAGTDTAQDPERLIDILYGILGNNLTYQIQSVSSATYAQGRQELTITQNTQYVSEVDVLLISPQKIGAASLWYDETEIPMKIMSYYAVGKIDGSLLKEPMSTLRAYTDTVSGQTVKVYVIGYRNLEAVLELDTQVFRNQRIPYRIYFKTQEGECIRDDSFYRQFHWSGSESEAASAKVFDGILQGELCFSASGNYDFRGQLSDEMGSYSFETTIEVMNSPPTGSIPIMTGTIPGTEWRFDLDEYFSDADGDLLQYTFAQEEHGQLDAILDGNVLSVKPLKSGDEVLRIQIMDGEETITSTIEFHITPLWQVYWWLSIPLVFLLILLCWRMRLRAKPKPGTVEQIKSCHSFNGRLDLYFTKVPDDAPEIPPLVFQLHNIHGSRICLGDLLWEYEKEVEALELNKVYLIADEGRRMILFHTSNATVMLGGSIACSRITYHISFGDVLSLTSRDGTYDLELRYISMIQ